MPTTSPNAVAPRGSDRKHERIEKCLPVSIQGRAAALSSDISAFGFCLEMPTLRTPGEVVSGYVLHGDKELTWTGRVQWVKAGNPMASTWHRVGVQFTKVSPGLRALLSMLGA